MFYEQNFRSTTLEDIYRHYEKKKSRQDEDDDDKDEDFIEDYDNTGYEMQQNNDMHFKLGHRGHSGGDFYYFPGGGAQFPAQHVYPGPYGGQSGYGGGPSSGHGGGGGHVIYAGPIVQEEHVIHERPPPPKHHGGQVHIIESHSEHSSSKEHDLSDLFDIALTALAYLSFGMFVIHVIMCISMTVRRNLILKYYSF